MVRPAGVTKRRSESAARDEPRGVERAPRARHIFAWELTAEDRSSERVGALSINSNFPCWMTMVREWSRIRHRPHEETSTKSTSHCHVAEIHAQRLAGRLQSVVN